jgi:hypothetical protein
LVTVPACQPCNNEASELDETFRLYLALHVGDLEEERTARYFYEALRTYRHNQRLQREILATAEPVLFSTPSGIIYGEGAKILWNSTAHDSIIERTVRGLYYHHFGEPLAPSVPVAPKWFHRPDQKFADVFAGCARNVIGNDQFCYRYGRAADHPERSVWFFEFYQRHWSGAHTGLARSASGS